MRMHTANLDQPLLLVRLHLRLLLSLHLPLPLLRHVFLRLVSYGDGATFAPGLALRLWSLLLVAGQLWQQQRLQGLEQGAGDGGRGLALQSEWMCVQHVD